MSTAIIQPHSMSIALAARSLPTYEFSKRKRWGDLLLSELVDDVAFILSPKYKILYCGPAVTELLGWRNVDLTDLEFTNLVDLPDQARFRIAFDEAVCTNVESDLAVRLRTNNSTTQFTSMPAEVVLFDIKFYPHNTGSEDVGGPCIIAMASPYPSRNSAMLATGLQLKAENERLQQNVTEHRNRFAAETSVFKNSPTSQAGSMYPLPLSQSARFSSSAFVTGTILRNSNDPTGAFSTSTMMSESFSSATSNAIDGTDFGKSLYAHNIEEQSDEGSKKKKLKRTQNVEQYVCKICGRTDSPEWRKGPDGPKTLCNACGLRWAKQMRKADDTSSECLSLAIAATDLQ
ncbi:GATA-domain-containing protein [Pholiota conissans]|uniref:GATA-domain-containing protein n=1 Tax=Pholiota conissans TaxID=109636 RepID=A0A9P5Z834_9AGAR|nr:GATA-domain-containing protein [Pholiota conissans]